MLWMCQGSGHFVPTTKPREALQMLMNFLRNTHNYSLPVNISVAPAPLLAAAPKQTSHSHLLALLPVALLLSLS